MEAFTSYVGVDHRLLTGAGASCYRYRLGYHTKLETLRGLERFPRRWTKNEEYNGKAD